MTRFDLEAEQIAMRQRYEAVQRPGPKAGKALPKRRLKKRDVFERVHRLIGERKFSAAVELHRRWEAQQNSD